MLSKVIQSSCSLPYDHCSRSQSNLRTLMPLCVLLPSICPWRVWSNRLWDLTLQPSYSFHFSACFFLSHHLGLRSLGSLLPKRSLVLSFLLWKGLIEHMRDHHILDVKAVLVSKDGTKESLVTWNISLTSCGFFSSFFFSFYTLFKQHGPLHL